MRRNPEFPTRDEWLARRGAPLEQATPDAGGEAGTDVQAKPEEQARLLGAEEQAELGDLAKPVISFRPKRPYWR